MIDSSKDGFNDIAEFHLNETQRHRHFLNQAITQLTQLTQTEPGFDDYAPLYNNFLTFPGGTEQLLLVATEVYKKSKPPVDDDIEWSIEPTPAHIKATLERDEMFLSRNQWQVVLAIFQRADSLAGEKKGVVDFTHTIQVTQDIISEYDSKTKHLMKPISDKKMRSQQVHDFVARNSTTLAKDLMDENERGRWLLISKKNLWKATHIITTIDNKFAHLTYDESHAFIKNLKRAQIRKMLLEIQEKCKLKTGGDELTTQRVETLKKNPELADSDMLWLEVPSELDESHLVDSKYFSSIYILLRKIRHEQLNSEEDGIWESPTERLVKLFKLYPDI